MLDLNEVKKEYPPKLHSHPRDLLREYLQYRILRVVFSQPYSQKLVFIGGTALGLVYKSTRFSEDLDFDNFGLKESEFLDLSEAVRKDLEKEGYQVEIKNVRNKKAFRCYVKIPELLFKEGLSPMRSEKLVIQIDTTPQGYKFTPSKEVVSKFDIFIQVNVVSSDLLLSQKICAVFERPRSKGRDFYDITFLWGKTEPDYNYLKEKLGIKSKEELLDRLEEKAKSLDFEDLVVDVEGFLFDSRDKDRVIKFPAFLEHLKTTK